VKEGKAPPPSRYPRLADGSLVAPESLPAPPAPDTRPTAYLPFRVDAAEPPKILGTYPTFVSGVDADGKELAGVRMPLLAVPLGTHRPWNLRSAAFGFPHHRTSFLAAYLPFSTARIAERYRSREDYLGRFTAETLALIEARYLVKEDLHFLL
jgi:hypothetical protein